MNGIIQAGKDVYGSDFLDRLNQQLAPKGAAPLKQELLSGRIQVGGDQLSSSLGEIRTGTVISGLPLTLRVMTENDES